MHTARELINLAFVSRFEKRNRSFTFELSIWSAMREVSWTELAAHNTPASCWIAVEGRVYDVTTFAHEHPGGVDNILLAGGRECTTLFASYHPLWVWKSYTSKLGAARLVGTLSGGGGDAKPHNDHVTPFYLGMKAKIEAFFKQTGRDPRLSRDMLLRIPLLLVAVVLLHAVALHWYAQSALVGVAASVLHGLVAALICLTAVHEASHSSLLHAPLLWKLVGVVSHNFLNGANFHAWQNQHVTGHHLLTNVHEGDPDVAGGVFRFSPHSAWQAHHAVTALIAPLLYGLLSMRTRIRDLSLFFDGKQQFGTIAFNFNRRALELGLLLSSKLFFVSYRVLLPWLSGMPLWRVLLLVTLSDFVGSVYLAFLFQCNHVAEGAAFPLADATTRNVDQDWAKMQLATTQDYGHRSYLTYFMTGALNYQVTHHLFPYISQGHYRDIAPLIQAYCAEHKVEYVARDNVVEAARAHLGLLHELGAAPKTKSA
jgi:fatty acid desaturase/predicted heme/steroid binding protein